MDDIEISQLRTYVGHVFFGFEAFSARREDVEKMGPGDFLQFDAPSDVEISRRYNEDQVFRVCVDMIVNSYINNREAWIQRGIVWGSMKNKPIG